MVHIRNKQGQEVKPECRIVILESTDRWCEDIQERAGRLYEMFLFDFRRRVHVAEITPSYELHWLQTIYTKMFDAEHERERDRLESEIMEGNRQQPPVEYVHCHTVDALPFIDRSEVSISLYDAAHDDYSDEEELHSSIIDAVREYEQSDTSDYHGLIPTDHVGRSTPE